MGIGRIRRKQGTRDDSPHKKGRRQSHGCRSFFQLHPLFLIVGIWYCFKGELFLFLLSALVALQHECAHAFAAAKLGYKLNKIVLMPFGAVIDGDLHGISFKDEITVAICGPLCNLITAGAFVALWWFAPTMYAFTDTACYSSLSIAVVNLLPAYPLDGGRILKCTLARIFLKRHPDENAAEKKANTIAKAVTLFFAFLCFAIFLLQCFTSNVNLTLLAFAVFLCIGAFGNVDKTAVYDKINFSNPTALQKGVEIKRVAVSASCPIKDTFRFLSNGSFLVLEVYDSRNHHLFDLSQNQLSDLFTNTPSPYTTLEELYNTTA